MLAAPLFLSSVEDLQAHVSEHFEKLPPGEKGTRFAEFAARLIPMVQDLSEFGPIALSPKQSHDKGVDGSSSVLEDGRRLHMQSKLSLPGKEDFDSIISKFEAYEQAAAVGPNQKGLFDPGEPPIATFVIVTAQKMAGILSRYRESGMSSRPFYEQLTKERRLHIVDGNGVFAALQAAYGRTFGIPNKLELISETGWIHLGTVRLGFLKASDLLELHRSHGDALFFENIRDWLGPKSGKVSPDQLTVNQEIAETIIKEPGRFLERNNGVTFKAARVTADTGNRLVLTEASIVNGCQTTMSLVTSDAAIEDCVVQVKVVESFDAWDVAKAANYQNPVAKINLDLARYIRPQLVREAAAEAGIEIEGASAANAVSLLNSLYDERVNYEEIRYLYIGLLSSSPNNIVDQLYTKLRADLLSGFAENQANRKLMMEAMFRITVATRAAIKECQALLGTEEYIGPFMRVLETEKPRYRMFLAILTLSALLRTDISARQNEPAEMIRMKAFVEGA